MMKVLITGVAGFIGYHVAEKMLQSGHLVIGVDNLNESYDPALKKARLLRLKPQANFKFEKLDIAHAPRKLRELGESERPDTVINFAAQAGVRESMNNPTPFVQSNVVGFLNILETCRAISVRHLIYASSSSVYGGNTTMPFSVQQSAEHPVSLYAATKKSNELMAHSYSHLYGIPTTALRFFTVYGPWDRPNMALSIFARAILDNRPIDVFNHGEMDRDFTFIEDVAEGVSRLLKSPASSDPKWQGSAPNPARSKAPYQIFNIGYGKPIKLLSVVTALERHLGKRAIVNLLPMQAADMQNTFADTSHLKATIDFQPRISFEEGIKRFADWYLNYHSSQAT